MAKPQTKVVRYLLKKIGYDLQRLQKSIFHAPNEGAHFDRNAGFDAFDAIIPRPVEALDIYLRTCSRVEVFAQERKRIVGVPKSELTLRSLNSLLRTIGHAQAQNVEAEITLAVMDDHSDPAVVEQIKELLSGAACETRFRPMTVTGNGPTLKAPMTEAKENARDLVYFAEDDYLYANSAIFEIIRSYERIASVLDRDVILFPSDYPIQYRRYYMSYVLLGSHRHWRTVKQTTGATVTSRSILRKYWKHYEALGDYGVIPEITEEVTINKIYDEVPCLSPMSSLAVHLEFDETLSPYADWRGWWEASALD